MDVPKIAKIAFTSKDRVREVIHNFNADGFDSLVPEVRRWPATEVHAAPTPADQEDRPVTTPGSRSAVLDVELSKLAEFLWLRGWSTTSAMRAFGFCSERRACRFK
jgi:hypothetical protein